MTSSRAGGREPRRHVPNSALLEGLEADYIVLPNLTTGTYGFPSDIADDPYCTWPCPSPTLSPHAEERRLFYVALTRTRREVTLITPTQRISAFVAELLQNPNDPDVAVVGPEEAPVDHRAPSAERGRWSSAKALTASSLAARPGRGATTSAHCNRPAGRRSATDDDPPALVAAAGGTPATPPRRLTTTSPPSQSDAA